ncbi:MAG: hypothetical protein H6833_11615 [Planctomycetes bacterium]|nr:hypothetical protein [Planctomycetota bacterium]
MRTACTFLLFLAATLVYGSLFPTDADATIAGNDAVSYAMALRSDDPGRIVDAHHPLFHGICYGVLAAWRAVAPDTPLVATRALQLVSAVGGAASLAVLFWFAWRRGRLFALVLTAFAGTSMGLVTYSAVGESYTPAMAMWSLVLAITLARIARHRPLPLGGLVAVTVFALALRQDAILVVPIVTLAFLLADERGTRWTERGIRALKYVAGTGLLTLSLYGLAYAIHRTGEHPEPSPLRWLLHLAQSGEWGRFGDAPPWSAMRIASETTAGAWEYGLTWSSTFSVAADPGLPGAAEWLEQCDLRLSCGVRPTLSSFPAWFVWSAFLLPFAVLLTCASHGSRRAFVLAIGFVSLRLGFFAWWQPANMEYQFANAFPLLILVAVLPRDALRPATRGRWLVLGVLLISTIFTTWRNEVLLFSKLRQRHLVTRCERLERWQRAGARIVAVDDYVHYALQCFGDVPHETFLPAEEEERRAPLQTQILAALQGGPPIVFATDTVLPRALGLDRWAGPEHAYWGLDHLTRLLETAAPIAGPDGIRPFGDEPAWAIVVGAHIEER